MQYLYVEFTGETRLYLQNEVGIILCLVSIMLSIVSMVNLIK